MAGSGDDRGSEESGAEEEQQDRPEPPVSASRPKTRDGDGAGAEQQGEREELHRVLAVEEDSEIDRRSDGSRLERQGRVFQPHGNAPLFLRGRGRR
jgi:hypothetical protein